MGRRVALRPEILRCADEPATEKLGPPAVDGHAGHERILRIDEPTREIEAGGPGSRGREWMQNGGCARLHRFAGIEKVSARHDGGSAGLSELAHHECARAGYGGDCRGEPDFFLSQRGDRGVRGEMIRVQGLGLCRGALGRSDGESGGDSGGNRGAADPARQC